ncbi:MAG: hypothetical protein ACLS95_00305 [Clostridia bacterium]
MASCLGLYIEDNLIKYAKVAKEKDNLKIESFGIKFYDKLGDAINQIIAETFSYKVPISINLSEEAYNYFYFFSLLNKNDLKKAVETEFDSYCFDKGYNRNALESRYALVPDLEDKEKIKAIYISTNKAEINNKLQQFEGNAVSTLAPLPMAIPNIADIRSKETSLIVNIENKTTLTMIVNENIYDVTKMEEGMNVILDNINMKENSYSKAYEICKNSTIYTMEGKELQEEENLYLEDIMPTLYAIVQKVKEYADASLNKIDRIFITGTGSVINNIDLYFQEFFKDMKCEILKPYFVADTIKINMKDYIEVNSAIALAMQGLGYGIKNLNFKKPTFADKLPDFLKLEVGDKKGDTRNSKKGLSKINFSFSLKGKLDNVERWLLRTCIGIFSLFILYSAFTIFLDIQINDKQKEVETVKQDTQKQISSVEKDLTTINTKTTKYQDMKKNLEDFNNQLTQNSKTKNVIPVLLTELMSAIPKEGVTITSIENTSGTHIVINAQAERYELLGYFKGKIIADGILSPSTVISTSGVKQDNLIKIVIEGDLP